MRKAAREMLKFSEITCPGTREVTLLQQGPSHRCTLSAHRVIYKTAPRPRLSPCAALPPSTRRGSQLVVAVLCCLLSTATSFQLSVRGSETTETYFCVLRCQSKMKRFGQRRKVAVMERERKACLLRDHF